MSYYSWDTRVEAQSQLVKDSRDIKDKAKRLRAYTHLEALRVSIVNRESSMGKCPTTRETVKLGQDTMSNYS